MLSKAFEVLHAFTSGSRVMTFSERSDQWHASDGAPVLATARARRVDGTGTDTGIGVATLRSPVRPGSAAGTAQLAHLERLRARIGHQSTAVLRGRDASYIES